jgi:two-component system NtrC family sensor kinase
MSEDTKPAGTTTALPIDAAHSRTTDFAWITALYELGQRAANGADSQGARQAILEHIVRGFDAESGSIALVVEGTDEQLELAAGTDLPPGLIGSALPRGSGVFGHVMATGQPVLVNGDAAETGLPLRLGETRQRATLSAMCWPLFVAGTTIGAVAVNRAADRPRYTVADLDGGQALVSLLALVMANHRMHVERENRILELSTLNATMQRMNAMLEDAQNQVINSDRLASIGQCC